MSPLERVFPLKEISRIRIECGKCHTIASFPVTGQSAYNVGEHCPFCHMPWGQIVERMVLDIVKTLERNQDVGPNVVVA